MKSVCILLQNYYDGDIRVRRKAEALVGAGYSVDVLALRAAGASAEPYTLCGVTVHTFPVDKRRGSLFRYAMEYGGFLVAVWFKLLGLMRRKRYDVIDVNSLPDFLVFAAIDAKWRGAKVVFDMHEITPEFVQSKYEVGEGHWKVRLAKWIEGASMRFADHVITINEPIQRLLEGRGLTPAKSTVIMNSVDEALFASLAPKPGDPAPEDKNGFVMMYHGTLTRIYGLDIAIEAFALAQEQMPGAEFWILGGGPEKAALEALTHRLGLDGRVRFVGNVRLEEIPQWLHRCDVGVLATRRDVFLDFSFSNKLSEYVITDRPVIASRLNAIRHYFSEEALAFFEPNDPKDLARQMIRLYGNAGLRSVLAQRAREEYSPISWAVMKQRYLKMMDDLVGPAHAANTSKVACSTNPSL